MRKKICNIGFLLCIVLQLFTACTDEVVVPNTGDIQAGSGNKEIPIKIKLKTYSAGLSTYANNTDYAGETLVGGSAWENAVHDITVYVFDQAFNCEKIITATASPTDTVMVKTGTKNFITVVNAAGKMTLPATEATTNYAALKQMLTNATATLPTSPFLMTGELQNVPLPDELPESNPYSITLDVERACAKMTLRVTKSGQSLGHNINLTKVTLHQGANKVALLEVPFPNTTTYTLNSTKTTFDPSTGAVPNKGTGFCALADSFYTYESLCGHDKSKAVWIEIESQVNTPSNIRTARFYLGEYSTTPGDTTYDVKRNFWYNVTVDIVKPGMDSIYVTVVSCPWNVAASQDTAVGGGYEAMTSLPFKLVKPYTEAELTKTATRGAFAAIEKHTKGQSYIDLKVTQGTGWSLDFKTGVAANTGAKMALGSDSASWTSDWKTSLSGTGDGTVHRIWIYRPYVENAEPKAGPSLTLKVGGVEVRDFVVQPRDTTPIPTNCYIMRPQLMGYPVNETRAYIPLAGVYKYWEDELMANGDSIPAGNVTASISWKDHDGTIVQNVSVLNASKRDSAYIYAEAGPIQGNAIVDMKVGGVIYWSFHLWVTEYNPYEPAGQKPFKSSVPTDNIFMDRNLGALKNEYDAAGEARGMYYQNGRKDPFMRGKNWGNGFYTPNPMTTATPPAASSNLRPKSAIMAMLKHPTTFYTGSTWPFYTEDSCMWKSNKGNKTAFDPCPEGYRIPAQTTTVNNPWTKNPLFIDPAENFGRYDLEIGYYPLAGYISSSGTLGSTGSHAYFWSSSASATGGSGLHIGTTTENFYYNETSGMPNNRGYSVRCVVDANYLLGGGKAFGTGAGDLNVTPIP